ncbi:MAG: hypothetical protein COY40_04725 [Alphaproteobacteria bacterium CG_4_10_14_0_8_um_filter_53_9]|nr:MAG: hypothetical protein COY40_04725 [Alphaproteobacteria bacterium CG_4_10_14_0_8_um_filter_53_9]
MTHEIARKALRLNREAGFGLLVFITLIVSWVMSLGAGSAILLGDVYHDWALDRQETMRVYLPPDVNAEAVSELKGQIDVLQGVIRTDRMDAAAVRAALEPYVVNVSAMPLPVVLDIQMSETLDRESLNKLILQNFPTAEIDESKPLLTMMARLVRSVQTLVLSSTLAMVALMALLMSVTVRTSLRAHKDTIRLLVSLGAKDATVVAMVVRHVATRLVGGWVAASALSAAMVAISMALWPAVAAAVSVRVGLGIVLAPAVMVTVALITTRLTARSLLEHSHV